MMNLLKGLLGLTSVLAAQVRAQQLEDEAQALTDAKDYRAAFDCWRESAELGSANAAARLATCLMQGRGTTPDWKAAAEWLDRVPRDGRFKVMVNHGMLYAIGGYGLRRDLKKAKHYLQLAIDEEGDEAACDVLRMIEKREGIFGQKENAKPKIPWKD